MKFAFRKPRIEETEEFILWTLGRAVSVFEWKHNTDAFSKYTVSAKQKTLHLRNFDKLDQALAFASKLVSNESRI
jgi:hypothetical protein